MKLLRTLPFLVFGTVAFAQQQSEDFIPKDASTVFCFNNISILQKVSIDELVSYQFMTELQSELFDGSTQGKTMKDSGIDFNQKMNVFYGKNPKYEISGFTFGLSDKDKLFSVFDDFDRVEGLVEGVEYYNNYFNHLFVKGNVGMLIRVDSDQEDLTELADSIWLSRGFELPWVYDYEEMYDFQGEPMEEGEMQENLEGIEDGDEVEEVTVEEVEQSADPKNDELFKNYYELRDSLESELSRKYLIKIVEEMYLDGLNLKKQDSRLATQLTHTSDGIFYLDNSRNLKNTTGLWYFQSLFPELYKDLNELYNGNIMLGDLVLKDQSIEITLQANYGEALGTIYQKLNNTKFDKNVLKYVPKNSSGFFTYNINLREGYERAYDIMIPILSEEKNPRISSNVLIIQLLDEFINKDALFSTYKGSMFGTFNGVKRVKTKRIEFYYNEETFEYGEKEIEAEEDMPVFTLGFSTARHDIPDKVLQYMSRITSQFKDMGGYWVYEDAILNSLALYMINKNGLFILTNDEDLAKNHSNGYGPEAISSKDAKNAKKSGSVYGYLNLGDVINNLPSEMFNDKRYELLESMKGKKGVMELMSSKTTKQQTVYNMTYNFDGATNAGKYLLDLVNTAYILSKP